MLEATGLLKQLKPQLAHDAALRGSYERIAKKIDARKRAIRERCESLASAHDADRLVAFLAGQAANEIEPEEVCTIALDAARSLFQSHDAEGAAEILRLAPFRTLREEQLVRRHRELELQVHRVRARRHAIKGFMLLGSIIVAGAVGLPLFAWTLWFGNPRIVLWLVLLLSFAVVAVVAFIPQIRNWFLSKIGQATGRTRTANKLASFLRERRK